MRRRAVQALLLGAAAAAALVVPAGPAGAVGDASGPACADITDGSGGFYDGDVLHFRIRHSATTCASVTTKVVVFDETGSALPLATVAQKGDGASTDLFYEIPVNDNDTRLCVSATTSSIRRWRGAQIHDRAPDSGCAEFIANDTNPPGRPFR